MNELIGRLAVKVSSDNAVDRKSVGVTPRFLRNKGLSDKAQALSDRAQAWIDKLGEIKSVALELFDVDRDTIQADQMGDITAGTPGLSQFA